MTIFDIGTLVITALACLLGLFLIAFAIGAFIRAGARDREEGP